MKCAKCNHKFVKNCNWVNRIDGTKITVCPECGNEEVYDKVDDFSKYMNPPVK